MSLFYMTLMGKSDTKNEKKNEISGIYIYEKKGRQTDRQIDRQYFFAQSQFSQKIKYLYTYQMI